MDLLASLKTSIEQLPQGSHSKGLKSVLLHIEAAYRHLARAEELSDETAFTDAIYRCNQAFEGGIKEAYRVLAGSDPAKLTPFEIEQHLDKSGVFRGRVLALFTNYRKEWRNPSTHDYTLDFDEAEAFLAIISISGFTKLLIDQISRNIINVEIQNLSSAKKQKIPEKFSEWNLVSQAGFLAKEFCENGKHEKLNEAGFSLELARFLSLNLKDSSVEIEPQLESDKRYRPDLLLRHAGEVVVIEIKRGMAESTLDRGLWQIDNYTSALKTRSGLLIARSSKGESEYDFAGFDLDHNTAVLAVLPKNDTFGETELPLVLPEPH